MAKAKPCTLKGFSKLLLKRSREHELISERLRRNYLTAGHLIDYWRARADEARSIAAWARDLAEEANRGE